MLRLRQFTTLARLTALEAVRRPLCLLLMSACLVLTALTPLVLLHQFGEEGKMARDSGLACHFVFGLFIAGYTACSSLTQEVGNGTASTVLSKPVGRGLYFLAKFAGLAAVVVAFSLCCTLATLMAERVSEHFALTGRVAGNITDWQTGNLLLAAPFAAMLAAGIVNYFNGRPFLSTAFGYLLLILVLVFAFSGFFDRAGYFEPYSLRVQWRIIPAGVLIALALITLSAVALSISTRFSAVPTITICVCILVLGLMSDYLFGRHAAQSWVASVLYALLPNWQHFWVADALNSGGVIPWSYVARVGGYAAAYSGAVLCLGAISFRHREVV